MIGTIFFVFLLLLLIGVPLGIGMGIATVSALVISGAYPLTIVAHKMVNAVNSFPLVAVPLFILAGALAGEGSIALRLVRLSDALFGHIRGGLGHVNVAASMFFGGISGSAVADTAAMGSLLIPPMEKQGYSRADAAAITCCSSTIGVLIPPSIPMVLYGVTMSTSIGALFVAGLVPGVLVGVFQMALIFTLAKRKGWPQRPQRAPLPELWAAFREAFLSLLLPVFLLGSIISGVTTATEAGVIGVLYALILSGFVYREYRLRDLYDIVVNAAVNTAIPCFVVATTSVAAWIIAMQQFPQTLVNLFASLDLGSMAILALINVFLLFVGMFMDLVPALLLFAPILYPIAQAAGVGTVQFAAIMVINLGIGLVTPPVGNCLYLAVVLAKSSLAEVTKAVLPFIAINTFVLLLVTYVPAVSTWAPSLFFEGLR
jgi:C4-dicarboxylate transporter DctM subunit